jgi:importin subunit beta-1
LSALSAGESRAATAGAQLVAALAYVELPVNGWPDLMRVLHYNVVGVGADLSMQGLRRASLEALGYICEESLLASVLESVAGEIISSVVHGLGSGEPSAGVRQAAATALLNSLTFLRGRLEDNEEERNATFRAIFEAVSVYRNDGKESSEQLLPVAVGALECLVASVPVLYSYMRPYMHQGLGELTVNAMNSAQSAISLQGIEFWSTVCDVELDLIRDQMDALESGVPFEQPLHYFARDSSATVLPILLTRMASQGHQDDDEDAGDEWTPSMAAATCLSLYASVVADDLLKVPTLMRFIEENLASTDWHFREAAVLAFGSILEGPHRDRLQPLALNTFPALFRLFADPSVSVRDTNMWALGRVCELHPRFIPLEHAEQLAGSFAAGLKQPPRVAASAAWALLHLVRRIAGVLQGPLEERQAHEMLARILPQLAMLLMEASQRADADEASLRSAAFEVLAGILAIVPDSAADRGLLTELVSHVLNILAASIRLAIDALSVDEQVRASDIQSSCVGLLSTAIRRLGSENVQAATWERLGGAFLAVAQAGAAGKTAITSLEDLFLALGSLLTDITSPDVAISLVGPFMPYVLGILARPDEAQLCRVVIGFVSDVARACKAAAPVSNNLDPLVTSLQRILQSPTCQRDLKSLAITALGDLAAAVGGPAWCASPHFASTFAILGLASAIEISDEQDLDEVDFVCELRLALIEAITWIIQGAKDENSNSTIQNVLVALHAPIANTVLPFLTTKLTPWCLRELGAGSPVDPALLDDIIRAASGLIGDLAQLYPGNSDIRVALKPLARDFLRIVSDKISENTESTQKWAYTLLIAN